MAFVAGEEGVGGLKSVEAAKFVGSQVPIT